MTLSGLSAAELARIDAVCMQFEADLRQNKAPSIDEIVLTYGGTHREELRTELISIYNEVTAPPPPQWNVQTPPASSTKLSSSAKSRTDSSVAKGDSNVFQRSQSDSGRFDSGIIELPEPGTKLGPYLIHRQIARGGMGVVYAAYDERLNRKVAVKTLTQAVAKRRDLTERFEREARAIASISNPHVVELFDVGSFGRLPYVVMEFLDGLVLEDVLEKGRLPIEEVRRLGSQIAEALAAAHQSGVIHRDLKPQNIMLVHQERKHQARNPSSTANPDLGKGVDTSSMIAKVFDFGLSRMPTTMTLTDGNQPLGKPTQAGPEETREGVILGTPGYMAPEQAIGDQVTKSADFFALGCVLYELFYGKRAFEGETKSELIRAAVGHFPRGDDARRAQDPELAEIIDRCLEKETEDRPSNGFEIARQLRTTPPTSDVASVSLSRRALMVGTFAIAVMVGLVSFLRRQDAPVDPLHQIQSIAVLSFDDGTNTRRQNGAPEPMPPFGNQAISRGDRLAGLLVHELSQLPNLTVPKFHPISAQTSAQFRQLAKEFEVDALLTGTLTIKNQASNGQSAQSMNIDTFVLPEDSTLDLQLISKENGQQIWGNRFEFSVTDDLLDQTRIAEEIAGVIGRRLRTGQADPAGNARSFACFLDGELRADPDSPLGLEEAIMCFRKARMEDQSTAVPVAALALTSITLAAQSPRNKAIKLVEEATEAVREAFSINPNLTDAKLAEAMLLWQTRDKYSDADQLLQSLKAELPSRSRWQVYHQSGLLQLVLGRPQQAIEDLRQAELLNRFSISVKVDLARARWFCGDTQRAIADTERLMRKYPTSLPAIGLLIDIYEQLERYDDAINMQAGFDRAFFDGTRSSYLDQRKRFLAKFPYGPFGDVVNEMILDNRIGKLDEEAIVEMIENRTPMVSFVLAAHPAMESIRGEPRVDEILP